jgi:hypothetical protein
MFSIIILIVTSGSYGSSKAFIQNKQDHGIYFTLLKTINYYSKTKYIRDAC